jgi:uncharacterized protein
LGGTPMHVMLVDGYNVIRSSHLYDDIDSDDFAGAESGLNSAREALISDVAAMAQGYYDVTVVFDGAKNPSSTGNKNTIGGINIVFSKAGQTADAVIEKLVHEARERAEEIVVVTSDAMVQWTVLGKNVTRMSASNFANEIRQINAIGQEDMNLLVGAKKNTLAERISPAVAAKLEELAHRKE